MTSYENLRARQQAHIDAAAEFVLEGKRMATTSDGRPDLNDDIFTHADVMEKIENEYSADPYTHSGHWRSDVDGFEEILEERVQVLSNRESPHRLNSSEPHEGSVEASGLDVLFPDREADAEEIDEEGDDAGDDDVGDEDEIIRTQSGNAAYVGPAKGLDRTMQHISERPVRELDREDEGDDQETEDDNLVTLTVTPEALFEFVRYAEKSTARQVFEQLLNQ